jgi:hypothetical protein
MGGEGIEALGEAVTGGAAARAVEPEAGEAAHGHDAVCLNCGSELVGDYCHACGQQAHVHRTISAWWHDLAHGVLHLDGKIWRTLPLLAVRPGELTRRYVDGERAKFVSPLALFLFATFLMFAVLSLMKAPLDGAEGGAAAAAISEDLAKLDTRIRELEAQRAEAARRDRDAARIDARIEEAKRERNGLARAAKYMSSDEMNRIDFKTGWPALDKGIEKSRQNPSLLLYKLQANAYKFSWALIPLSLPFLWMLFLHRRRYRAAYEAYDHVVFITYSIAFMSLGLVALVLLTSLGVSGNIVGLAATIIPPVHIYRQLRGAYRLRRRSALWRTVALLCAAQLAIGLFFMLLLALGVMG